MRLLVVSSSYPNTLNPASGIFVQRMVVNLPRQFDVTVLAPGIAASVKGAAGAGPVRIVSFRYAPLRLQTLAQAPGGIPAALQKQPLAWLLVPLFCVGLAAATLRLARRADLIHANWLMCGLVAGIAGRIRRVPVVTTLRGTDVAWAATSALVRQALKWTLRLSQGVVVVSQAMAERLRSWFGFRPGHAWVISNGVAPCPVLPSSNSASRFDIAVIGTLSRVKQIDTAIRALAVVARTSPQARLVIVGEGPEEAALRSLTDRLNLGAKVQFLGGCDPEAVPGLLSGCRALVLASAHEGRPNVVLEAMAAGVPVVASDIDGVREIITPGVTGLLFACGDAQRLAEHLLQLWANPTLAHQLAVNARQWTIDRQLTWEECAGRYSELYHKVVANHRKIYR